MIQSPEQVLNFVAADADVDRLVTREVLLPRVIEHAFVERTPPLLRDTIANEQDIDGPLIRFHIIDQLGVCI